MIQPTTKRYRQERNEHKNAIAKLLLRLILRNECEDRRDDEAKINEAVK